jgi:vesicle-fusing ATPase
MMDEFKNSDDMNLVSILLEGEIKCGKTALAAHLALKSNFNFVKMLSPENFVGYTENAKVSMIVKVFEDAYKSPLSLLILDDIERLIEFIHFGPRFSNTILQALMVSIKKSPPDTNRKLMIIGTTSLKSTMS